MFKYRIIKKASGKYYPQVRSWKSLFCWVYYYDGYGFGRSFDTYLESLNYIAGLKNNNDRVVRNFTSTEDCRQHLLEFKNKIGKQIACSNHYKTQQ